MLKGSTKAGHGTITVCALNFLLDFTAACLLRASHIVNSSLPKYFGFAGNSLCIVDWHVLLLSEYLILSLDHIFRPFLGHPER